MPLFRALRLITLCLAASSCSINADYGDGSFSCTDECPLGLSCIGGRCVSGIDSGIDGPVADAESIDAAACTCEAVTVADDCGANVVDLDGVSDPGGELFCASTEANSNAVLGCTGQPMPGFDASFRVAASGGQTLTATVRPTGFDVSVYITRDCSGTCVAIADDVGISGTETVSVNPTQAGDYFVVVDSPSGMGCYELTVTLE